MDFGGDLKVLEPSIVFQIFSMSGLTGVLKFITISNVASFYFKEGDLLSASIDTGRKKIGRSLVEKVLITTDQLREALKEFLAKGGREKIGQIMINRGYLDYDSLAVAIQEQMKETVYEVLPWKHGHFIFFSGVQPGDEDIYLDIKIDHLILEGLKRLDESRGD